MVGYGLSVISIMLAGYLLQVENGACAECDWKNCCFGQKQFGKLQSLNMYEFIFMSFIKERKKCKCIEYKFRKRYIVCAIIVAFLEGILFWSKDFSLITILYGISIIVLWMICIVDWNTQYIPMEYTCIIFLCGLIQLFADFSNWLQYLIGLIAVSGFLFVVNRITTPLIRKRYQDDEIDSVIGDGDIKLMAATGLLLGWKLNFIALGIGCIAGSAIHLILMKVKGSGRQFAFGPYLSLGVYITMICGEQLVSWYLNILGVNTLL